MDTTSNKPRHARRLNLIERIERRRQERTDRRWARAALRRAEVRAAIIAEANAYADQMEAQR